MATDASLIGGSSDLGKGLFGYRKGDVQQMLSDRDLMLRQAESRIRGSEVRISELERTLTESNDRNARPEEQLERLRGHAQSLSTRNAEVEALAARVQAEVKTIAAWRHRIVGAVGAVAPAVTQLRTLLDQVPARVEQALSPLAVEIPNTIMAMDAFAKVARGSEI